MTTQTKPHIKDEQWLRSVRQDVDSAIEEWPLKTPAGGMTKLQVLSRHLDVILTELGHQGRRHACPECGIEHMAP